MLVKPQPQRSLIAAAWLALIVTTVGTMSTGCSSIADMVKAATASSKKDEPPALPPSGPMTVRVDSTALALNQPEQELEVQRRFEERFQTLLNEDRSEAARLWVFRHPDLAWELLRDAQAPYKPWMLELAAYHDQQCIAGAQPGWRDLLAARNSAGENGSTYDKSRQDFMKHLRNGRFEQAQKIDLVSLARQSEQPLLEIDAWYQTAIACLLTEQPTAAVGALEQCVRLAQNYAPYQAAHAQLLLSEARRRAGNDSQASQDWVAAVTAGAELLARPVPIADPTFWDRAMYLHPVSLPWPDAVASRVEQLAAGGSTHARSNDIEQVVAAAKKGETDHLPMFYITTCLGCWQHERGDHQGAVVTLKKAEAIAPPQAVDWLRIAQAKAIAGLGQSSPATALLAEIAGRKDTSPVCHAAMADLGTLQLSAGRVPQGLGLLRNAVDTEPAVYWPGRASAEADYALALLMVGEESAGLAMLEHAKQRFEQEGDTESLAKCLWNEAQFYTNAENKTELKLVQNRLDSMKL